MSEEAARQIDREDMALRVAEAPQLAQGLASDAKAIGLVLPLLPPEAVDAVGPALAAGPAHEAFNLAAMAHELFWQSAMAELLAMVRLEGAAAVDGALAEVASANAIELLLADGKGEDSAAAAAIAEPQPLAERPLEHDGLQPSAPAFVDSAFGNLGVSVLSLQNKDLFGFDGAKEATQAQVADFDGSQVIDYDLFGSQGAQGFVGLSSVDVPIVVGRVRGVAGGGGSLFEPVGIAEDGKVLAGLLKLDPGQQNIAMDLQAVLDRADETHSLVVRGDGDDNLKLIGGWMLVSETPEKSVSVYVHGDSGTTVTADHVEVLLA